MIYTKCIFDVYTVYITNSRTPGPIILFEFGIFASSPCIFTFFLVYDIFWLYIDVYGRYVSLFSAFRNPKTRFPALYFNFSDLYVIMIDSITMLGFNPTPNAREESFGEQRTWDSQAGTSSSTTRPRTPTTNQRKRAKTLSNRNSHSLILVSVSPPKFQQLPLNIFFTFL